MTESTATSSDGSPTSLGSESAREAADLVASLIKALKGFRLYLPNNQVLRGFVGAFGQSLVQFLEDRGELELRIAQHSLTFDGETVYESSSRDESFSFRLFIHGFREITFHPGCEGEEIWPNRRSVSASVSGS